MEKRPILSIIIPTYNHDRFIGKALDSVLKQKTQYEFETLVGEDFSSDNTKNILIQYEKEYPGFFSIYYRTHNMHKDKICNVMDLYLRAKGKYVICLEGDDYWISDNKIEKQISFLENNPDYIAVAHNCLVVDENDNKTGEFYPESYNEEYSLIDYLHDIYPGQTATVMYRNYFKYHIFDTSILEMGLIPGDALKYYCFITNGRVFCFQDKMSAYRHITNTGTSFSANKNYDFNSEEKWHISLYDYAKKQNNKFGVTVAGVLYMHTILVGLKRHKISLYDSLKSIIVNIDNKWSVLYWFIRRYIYISFNRRK